MNQTKQINSLIRFKSHPNRQYSMFASIDHMMKGSMAQ